MSNVLDFLINWEEMYRIDVNINWFCFNVFIVVVIGGVGLKILKVVVYVFGVNFIL